MTKQSEKKDELILKRVISAPRERVFRAWTEPEQLRKWWRVGEDWTTPIVEIDLRAGGRFKFGTKPPRGDLHTVQGEYIEVIPPERLVYSWSSDAEKGQSVVSVEFHVRGSGTEVVVTHRMLTRDSFSNVHTGWTIVLDRFVNLLQKE